MTARGRISFLGLIASGLALLATPVAAIDVRAGSGLLRGTAHWESIGKNRCGLLPAEQRVVEMRIDFQGNAAPSDSLLLLDRQLVFKLERVDANTFVASSLETRGESAVGRLVFGPNHSEAEATLGFARFGEACRIRVQIRGLSPVVPEDAAVIGARLAATASIARHLNEVTRLLREKVDAKGARAPAKAAYDEAWTALGRDEVLTGITATLLGSVNWAGGEFAAARDLAQQAIEISERLQGPTAAATLEARKNHALYSWELGDLQTARTQFEALRPVVAEATGVSSNANLALLANLAALYQELGLPYDATEIVSQAYLLREQRDGPLDRRTLVTLNNLAMTLGDVGRGEDKRTILRDAYERYLRAFGPLDPDTLRVHSNLGSLLCIDNSADCSVLQEAVRLRSEVIGPDHPETLLGRAILGHAKVREGRPAEAVPELRAVYEARIRKLTARHWLTAEALAGLGRARMLAGEENGGLAQMNEATEQLEKALGPANPKTLNTLGSLGDACSQISRRDCARNSLELLVERAEGERGLVALQGRGRIESTKNWVTRYRELARLQVEAGDTEAAVRTIELSKARALLATLGLKSAERAAGLPPESIDRIGALERQLATFEDQRSRSVEPERIASIELEQSSIAQQLSTLRAELRRKYPKYAAATTIGVPDSRLLARALVPGELFMGFAIQGDGFLVYVTDSSSKWRVVRISYPQLNADVLAWRSAISSLDSTSLWLLADGSFVASAERPATAQRTATLDELGAKLTANVLNAVPTRRAGRLVISPDGVLATLPFETLPWNGAPLISRFDIRYAQSLSIYALLRERTSSTRSGTLFAMGGPTYGVIAEPMPSSQVQSLPALRGATNIDALVTRSSNDARAAARAFRAIGVNWTVLPGAEREARSVAALFPGARVLTGDSASEEVLQRLNNERALATYRYLLFSAHGYLSTQAPALSALVLRQPGSDGADGYVTAAEWAAYDLRSELIVMSACETGLGKEVAGEGVMGLPYALFVAGNRNTLLTLWKVPDQSTSDFVVRFFRKVRAGVPHATALAQTKREFVRDTRYRAPIHWAGFVLYGS